MKRRLRLLASWETFLGALCILALAASSFAVPNFATSDNLSQAAASMAEKALMALPLTLIIIARDIDISIASILGLSSVVLGLMLQAGIPLLVAIPVVVGAGALAGAFNGVLVTRVGLPSLVVTLGTMSLFRGLGYILLGTASVNILPQAMTDFGVGLVPGTPVPWTIVPFLVLLPVFAIVLHGTTIGRRIYAIGGNPETALYSGINVRRLRMWMFVASGAVCALAGVVYTARLSNARADNALGFELDVLTVCFLGGVSFLGGRGRISGIVWALILVALVRNVLGLEMVGGDAQGIAVGLLLITSILVTNVARAIAQAMESRGAVKKAASSEAATAGALH
jgi:rhamnose transport system permease protein